MKRLRWDIILLYRIIRSFLKVINPLQERIMWNVVYLKAIKNDIVIYSAHTNLDNAPGGVNFKISREDRTKERTHT